MGDSQKPYSTYPVGTESTKLATPVVQAHSPGTPTAPGTPPMLGSKPGTPPTPGTTPGTIPVPGKTPAPTERKEVRHRSQQTHRRQEMLQGRDRELSAMSLYPQSRHMEPIDPHLQVRGLPGSSIQESPGETYSPGSPVQLEPNLQWQLLMGDTTGLHCLGSSTPDVCTGSSALTMIATQRDCEWEFSFLL